MTQNKIEVRLAVDVGGTFTDIVLKTPETQTTVKVLTTTSSPEEAVIAGAKEVFASAGIDPVSVDLVLPGTTLATNSILERKGAVTALIPTTSHAPTTIRRAPISPMLTASATSMP